MKRVIPIMLIISMLLVSSLSAVAAEIVYTPPTSYGAPENIGVVFNDDTEGIEGGRWSFDIGYSASTGTRLLAEAYADGRFEDEGYNSMHISVQGDYKLDQGKWRSDISGYDDWVNNQESGFDANDGNWVGNWHIYDGYFDEALTDGILPGGASYFDTHTMSFRVRFFVSFYNENSGEDYTYYSPWSQTVSYNNNQKVENPDELINHEPKLMSVELKEYEDGTPYLEFKANKAHDDLQLLNSISNQRVGTNVWLRVNNGTWVDAGAYMWMKESFTIDAKDYFGVMDSYDAAVYEAKFRYTFNYDFYPAAGKSGNITSPFSNIITQGMPAYDGASSWALNELNKAVEYGLITDRVKDNMAGKVTREEFAEIALKLYETYTGKKATVGSITFVDTTNPEILKAANLGLVAGVGNNKYAPKALVTREQMAAVLLRALKVIKPDGDFANTGVPKFADDKQVESWARDGVYFCSKSKIVTGVGNNMFNPDGDATREMAVIVCKRAYEFFKK